jgi:hypothetical protein
MTPRPGSRPRPAPDDGVERGDDRRRVAAAQGAHLGREPFPESPDGRLGWLDQQLGVVAADVEPQEIKALAEADDLRLVLVESQAPGRQPSRELRLDAGGLLLAVAEHDHVIGVPDRDRGAWHDLPGASA